MPRFRLPRISPFVLALLAAALCACSKAPPAEPQKPAHDPGADAAAVDARQGARTPNVDPAPVPAEGDTAASPGSTLDPVAQMPKRWYRMDRDGRPVGYFQVTWEKVEWRGRPAIRDLTVSGHWYHRKISHMNDIFVSRSRHVSIRGEDGRLFEARSEVEQGDESDRRISHTSLVLEDGGYRFTARLQRPDGEISDAVERFHPCDETIVLDAEAFLVEPIRTGEFKEGVTLEFNTLSGERGTVYRMRAEITGRQTESVLGEDVECLEVTITSVESGASYRERFTPQGLLVAVLQGENTTTLTTEADIEKTRKNLESGAVRLSSPVRDSGLYTRPDLPGAFNLARLDLEAVIQKRPHVLKPPFVKSPFMEVLSAKEDERSWRYTLRLKAHDKDVTAKLPLKNANDFAPHLEATTLMQVDAPEVVAAAEEAVAGETDARKAAQAIATYVYTTLEKESGSIGQYSAVEILKNGYGDCSEHALLFVALCRAAGIPARQVSGYVCLGNQWGNHAWAEIWVGGWIGADPCTCDIGTSARYIFFGYPDEPHSKSGLVSAAFTGYATLHLVEGQFGDGEPVNLQGRERTAGRQEDGTTFNWLSGVGLAPLGDGWACHAFGRVLTVRGEFLNVTLQVMPDQGARQMATLKKQVSDGDEVTVHGFPALDVKDMWGGSRMFVIMAHRRLVVMRIGFQGGTSAQKAEEWKTFFSRLDLAAWKGTLLEPGGEAPELPAD